MAGTPKEMSLGLALKPAGSAQSLQDGETRNQALQCVHDASLELARWVVLPSSS